MVNMKVTVLGSGTSTGVPTIGCPCAVCHSTNPRNKRLRSSCLFEVDGKNILIDTSPDLRQQALTHSITHIDAVLYTHNHADHVHGIDDLRIFNVWQKSEIPVFGDIEMLQHLQQKFPYIFKPLTDYPSLVPKLGLHPVSGRFDCLGISVQMIPCHHGPVYQTHNYRIGDVAWLTDTNGIPDASRDLLQNLKVLFIDGLRHKPHNTHFCLQETLKEIDRLKPEKAYLIHLAHDYDHDVFNPQLPQGVELAYDGLTVVL